MFQHAVHGDRTRSLCQKKNVEVESLNYVNTISGLSYLKKMG